MFQVNFGYKSKWFVLALFFLAIKLNVRGQTFIDIAPSEGIFHTVNTNLTIGGSGVSFFDFDNDGWDDITFVQVNDSIVFYKNVEGDFQQLPSFIYSPGETKQLLWVDYDNDGDNDAFLVSHNNPIKLFNNDGNFNFTDVTAASGLMALNSANYGVSFADYDRDGYLDFYLARYYNFDGDPEDPLISNALYKNNGDGTFTNVTVFAGVGNGTQPTFMGVWVDINHDLWPDLYVINDRLLWGNSMYLNNGDGTFTDIADESGTAMFGEDPMGATFDDFDNDGDIDILCSNGGPPTKPIRFYVNQGNNTFVEMAQQLQIVVNVPLHCTWGASWVDVNNDTFLDLYITTGLLTLNADEEKRSFLFMSNNAAAFTDSPTMFLSEHLAASYAVAKGDIDNDGYPDLVVQNAKQFNSFIWKNQVPPQLTNSYIKVTLQGTSSNKMAIGSWITLYANNQQYTHYTRCGENYISQDSQHHIFGLGQATVVDSIQIEYPGGHVDHYYNIPVNQTYEFVEGESYQAFATASSTSFCEGDSVQLFSGMHHQITWNTGSTDSILTVTNPGEYYYVAQNEFGVTTYSDTLSIDMLLNPVISVETHDPLCFGDENGNVWLINELGVEPLAVNWTNGMEGDSLFALSAGNYFFEYIDINGCASNGIAQLNEPDELTIQSFTTSDFGTGDGTITLNIFGGTPPYLVLLNGLPESTTIENLAGGTYQIEIIDDHGCSELLSVFIDLVSNSTSLHYGRELEIFPNPTSGVVNITGEHSFDKILLKDLTGRIYPVFSVGGNRLSLDLANFAAGMYMLEAHSRGQIYSCKLIIQ